MRHSCSGIPTKKLRFDVKGTLIEYYCVSYFEFSGRTQRDKHRLAESINESVCKDLGVD